MSQIDGLLSKGRSILLKDHIKVTVIDRMQHGLAPFHGGKTKTVNDGLIFFTTVHFAISEELAELTFVATDSDFQDPTKKYSLHPDLLQDGLSILYFSAIEQAFQELENSGKLSGTKKTTETENYILHAAQRGKKNFLDYLHEVLTVCQEKMPFIPPSIFCRIHPFRIPNRKINYTYFTYYTLHTNNVEFLEFYEGIDIDKARFSNNSAYRNTKGNLVKLKFIIETLIAQAVFRIDVLPEKKIITVKSKHVATCTCPSCRFVKFEWKGFDEPYTATTERLKVAFVKHHLGYWSDALKLYHACYTDAIKNGNKILAYQLKLSMQWASAEISSPRTLKCKLL